MTLATYRTADTQCEQVIAFMQEHGGITKRDAINKLDCANLPGRIFDIKAKHGEHSVVTDMVPNASGRGKHAVYRWRGSLEPQGELPL